MVGRSGSRPAASGSQPLLHLENAVGNQSVSLAMHGAGGLRDASDSGSAMGQCGYLCRGALVSSSDSRRSCQLEDKNGRTQLHRSFLPTLRRRITHLSWRASRTGRSNPSLRSATASIAIGRERSHTASPHYLATPRPSPAGPATKLGKPPDAVATPNALSLAHGLSRTAIKSSGSGFRHR